LLFELSMMNVLWRVFRLEFVFDFDSLILRTLLAVSFAFLNFISFHWVIISLLFY
jgi:hypothetical protein